MKTIMMACALVLMLMGCSKTSSEYDEFISKYGSDTRVFCDGVFLMRETYMSPKATAPQLMLINSQECKDKYE